MNSLANVIPHAHSNEQQVPDTNYPSRDICAVILSTTLPHSFQRVASDARTCSNSISSSPHLSSSRVGGKESDNLLVKVIISLILFNALQATHNDGSVVACCCVCNYVRLCARNSWLGQLQQDRSHGVQRQRRLHTRAAGALRVETFRRLGIANTKVTSSFRGKARKSADYSGSHVSKCIICLFEMR